MDPEASHNLGKQGTTMVPSASILCFYTWYTCEPDVIWADLELHSQAMTKINKQKTPRTWLSVLNPYTMDWYSSMWVFPGILSC